MRLSYPRRQLGRAQQDATHISPQAGSGETRTDNGLLFVEVVAAMRLAVERHYTGGVLK